MLTAVYGPDHARTVSMRVDATRRRTEHSGTDAVFAAQVLARAGSGRDIVFGDARESFRFRYRTRRDGQVSMVTLGTTSSFSGVFAPSGRVMVAWSQMGGVRITTSSAPRVTRPGVPVLLPTVGPFTVTAPAGTLQLLSIDRTLFEQQQRRRGTRLPEFGREASPETLVDLRDSIKAAAIVASDDHANTRRRRDTEVQLVDAVLHTFSEPELRLVRPSTVELAVAFLETQYARTITLTDICDAAGVSPRTLQTWFMQCHGISPMAFLQLLRLDRAQAALQAGNRGETSVATIAYDCGFRHMGRFAGAYLRRFNEYPTQTLRTRVATSTLRAGADRALDAELASVATQAVAGALRR
ncbi:helix-turn-helix transcriptional regulator [Curtobacterium sp. MCPF17_021]|uniref:helix-turn-helix transcriptional regulator n=1 Tax=Curtobacterium sp. MCPF17_021 TaxID=2175639 RepID=UPI000DA85A32|nr:helix-turn-helix transcriptional regulator [Curtobacterium sp. MCPF17_021]WIE85112.1 helix-turn-helix transcriptional regulator [Curtobacterium sp. MCPF17_021]